MPTEGFPLKPDSVLTVSAEPVRGRVILALGRPDGRPEVLADSANEPVEPRIRILTTGDWILHLTAHDHGTTAYDVGIAVKVTHPDEDPTLVTGFRFSNPGGAGGNAEGKEIHFTVSA